MLKRFCKKCNKIVVAFIDAICQYKEEASRFVDKPSADREVFISIIVLRGVLIYEKDIAFLH